MDLSTFTGSKLLKTIAGNLICKYLDGSVTYSVFSLLYIAKYHLVSGLLIRQNKLFD